MPVSVPFCTPSMHVGHTFGHAAPQSTPLSAPSWIPFVHVVVVPRIETHEPHEPPQSTAVSPPSCAPLLQLASKQTLVPGGRLNDAPRCARHTKPAWHCASLVHSPSPAAHNVVPEQYCGLPFWPNVVPFNPAHGGHEPPQSARTSSPFNMRSWHVGSMQISAEFGRFTSEPKFALHTRPEVQSVSRSQSPSIASH